MTLRDSMLNETFQKWWVFNETFEVSLSGCQYCEKDFYFVLKYEPPNLHYVWDLLGGNHCTNYQLNNGLLYSAGTFALTNWSTFVWTDKFNNGLCTHFLRFHGLKISPNSSHPINRKCKCTLRKQQKVFTVRLFEFQPSDKLLTNLTCGVCKVDSR